MLLPVLLSNECWTVFNSPSHQDQLALPKATLARTTDVFYLVALFPASHSYMSSTHEIRNWKCLWLKTCVTFVRLYFCLFARYGILRIWRQYKIIIIIKEIWIAYLKIDLHRAKSTTSLQSLTDVNAQNNYCTV